MFMNTVTNTNRDIVGTAAWAAPEYLDPKRIGQRNEKGDVYSFGVIAWELVTRQMPWSQFCSAMDIVLSVLAEERLAIPSDCDKILEDIMTDCWSDGNV